MMRWTIWWHRGGKARRQQMVAATLGQVVAEAHRRWNSGGPEQYTDFPVIVERGDGQQFALPRHVFESPVPVFIDGQEFLYAVDPSAF